jgi:diadenosine tetraphosphate (Ap4A) HIT family hydrolase
VPKFYLWMGTAWTPEVMERVKCDHDVDEGGIIKEHWTAIAIRDKYPVTEDHTLVLPRRHTPDFFTMTPQERRDAEAA